MKTLSEVEHRLHQLGLHNRFWGRPEVRELHQILADDEVITNACRGRYEGGFALLVTTDRRLLLIDKKMWFLSLENIRYDMISEVDYSARLLDATIFIRTINKVMRFSTFSQHHMRALTGYVQEKVMELRSHEQQAYDQMMAQQQLGQQFQGPAASAQPMMVQMPVVAAGQMAQPLTPRVPMRPFKRIGSYPTAAITMQRRFSARPSHR